MTIMHPVEKGKKTVAMSFPSKRTHMKKLLGFVLVALATLSLPVLSQTPTNAVGPTFASGLYYSTNYNYGTIDRIPPMRVAIGGGTNATGAGTITVDFGYFTTPDGRLVTPFTNITSNGLSLPPITVDSGAQQETVTPSSVSCQTPQVLGTCQITATFSNTHGTGARVQSGDQGIQEAQNDAALQGGGMVMWVIDPGTVTLSTGAANTNLGSVKIPTRSVVMSASAKVTTTIATCAGGWSLGFSTGTEFTAANTTLTAGTTTDSSTITLPAVMSAAAVIPIAHCTTSNASAGAIHTQFWGYKVVAPAF